MVITKPTINARAMPAQLPLLIRFLGISPPHAWQTGFPPAARRPPGPFGAFGIPTPIAILSLATIG
jgi:hypothetical protein